MPKKEKPKCRKLDRQASQQLAKYIIAQTESNLHRGVNRKKRITAPGGAVMLF